MQHFFKKCMNINGRKTMEQNNENQKIEEIEEKKQKLLGKKRKKKIFYWWLVTVDLNYFVCNYLSFVII